MDAIISKARPEVQVRRTNNDAKIDRILGISLIASFACGIAAPIAGLVLAVIHAVFPSIPAIDAVATVFCISTIPFLLLGSHLMDVTDRRRQRRREAVSAEELY
jgi:hypothetical protein